MQEYLQQDIQFLPGVGPKRAELLREELDITGAPTRLRMFA